MTTALLSHSPWTPIFALDRLNSWVRSRERWASPQGLLKRPIYWTKTHAILDLSKHLPIAMRRVMVRLECNKCNGSGRFYGWWSNYSDNGEPCRGCKATGTARLKFIQTDIGPIRWHTPQDKWFFSSLDSYLPYPSYYERTDDYGFEWAEDWKPNQPGKPLSEDEALRDLLIVFRRWPHDLAFSLDYHFDAKIETRFKCPDIRKGEQWIRGLFESGKLPTSKPCFG